MWSELHNQSGCAVVGFCVYLRRRVGKYKCSVEYRKLPNYYIVLYVRQ